MPAAYVVEATRLCREDFFEDDFGPASLNETGVECPNRFVFGENS